MRPSVFAAVAYAVGGLGGLISVAASALAAHSIADLAPTGAQAAEWFKQAANFEMEHALGLVVVAAISERLALGRARTLMRLGAMFLAAAGILFPAALYSVSFNGPVFFAPVGGLAAMIGWALFGVGALLTLQSPAAAD